jgi:hypothetical protein
MNWAEQVVIGLNLLISLSDYLTAALSKYIPSHKIPAVILLMLPGTATCTVCSYAHTLAAL